MKTNTSTTAPSVARIATDSLELTVDATPEIPRIEHPRPQFFRDAYQILNGLWQFAYDDDDAGLRERWYEGGEFPMTIVVPFSFQSRCSGIGDRTFHDIVWYRRRLTVDPQFAGKRLMLHFGAVDYEATVWVNGRFAMSHRGGHTPFGTDITDLLQEGDNMVVVRAYDDSRDVTQPRGKQYWEEESASIFYTRTTGIWQTVWLEAVPVDRLESVVVTPLVDAHAVDIHFAIARPPALATAAATPSPLELHMEVRLDGTVKAHERVLVLEPQGTVRIALPQPVALWSPDHPELYDITYRLVSDGRVIDHVDGYFGMRKIAVENGKVFLNNRPYYLRMVLDQGYFPDGILTPPSDDAIRRDVELTKALGFNGARKHQKVEDPRFLYWCDRLGLLVWGEMANAYRYSETAVSRLTSEWQEAVLRDRNHPCLIAWVPLNESWGVPELLSDPRQRDFLVTLYHLTKALDPSRPVISNDGWEHAVSDLCTIHDYESRKEVLKARYQTAASAVNATPGHKLIHAPGFAYDNEPILITEMGGISFKQSDWSGWGYSHAESEEDFLTRYQAVIEAMLESPVIQGFCYTQLTDVEQEINGLLTYDRIPKAPIDVLRAITEGRGRPLS
ncbi:MAG: glycoside hydrolase family 2 [Firmicutes bacterium]|nr:glycoside hydrolase family 2 [Bacillota bacterium]